MHNAISAGAPPQTLLGELTALPQKRREEGRGGDPQGLVDTPMFELLKNTLPEAHTASPVGRVRTPFRTWNAQSSAARVI